MVRLKFLKSHRNKLFGVKEADYTCGANPVNSCMCFFSSRLSSCRKGGAEGLCFASALELIDPYSSDSALAHVERQFATLL